jgi:hypothetical protein
MSLGRKRGQGPLLPDAELNLVETGRCPAETRGIEKRPRGLAEEAFLVRRRVPEMEEIGAKGFGAETTLAVDPQASCPRALRERSVVETVNQREMSVDGRRTLPGGEKKQLPRRVVEMVDSADDVGDPHEGIVEGVGEEESGGPVGTHEDEVVERAPRRFVRTENEIDEADGALPGQAETPSGVLAVCAAGVRLLLGQSSATAVVARRESASKKLVTSLGEILGRAETGVSHPPRDQFLESARVERVSLRLTVGTEVSPTVGSLVPLESEPAKVLEECGFGSRIVTFTVRVLDAQDEPTAQAPGPEKREEGGTYVADVEAAARTRRKAEPRRRVRTVRRGGKSLDAHDDLAASRAA